MHHVRQENLPFVGSSHEFVGAQQGDTGVSVFLFNGKPGSGPGPHRHPYDEIQFIQGGRGLYTVNDTSLRPEQETSSLSRPGRSTASSASATKTSCSSTSTS